jgi:uncharacterized caspase-like protein
MNRLLVAFGSAVLGAFAVAGHAANGSRVALVIGNAHYQNAPDLKNPANDATDMCKALARLGYRTLCHTDVRDREQFASHVEEFVDLLRPDSVGVFFYAGHGVQADGANFLIPTQIVPRAAAQNPLRELYGVEELFDRLREKPTFFKLVILDACRTDLFASASREPAGRSLARSLEAVPHASYGLAPIRDAPAGTKVLYATASKGAAYDGEGRNGPLTKHVLRHIGTPALPIDEFFRLVTLGVETDTRDYRKRQTPFVYGSFGGEFCLAGCRRVVVPPVN